jgi:hypothetical protein
MNMTIHNSRKNGYMIIGELRSELQKRRNAEKELEEALGDELKRLEKTNARLCALKETCKNKAKRLAKLQALTAQKQEDICRMDVQEAKEK